MDDDNKNSNPGMERSPEELAQLMALPPRSKGIHPSEARRIMEKRKLKEVTYRPGKKIDEEETVPLAAAGMASNTVQSPASIVELARALKNDVDLIFYHVYNNIEYYPGYGLQKGSLGCLIDGNGNPFDQCQLLVDLLREAGHTADFVSGEIDLSQNEVNTWLGIDAASTWDAYYLLSDAGVPANAYWTGSAYRIEISHIWVKVDIGGTDFVFDPSIKAYTDIEGIDLAAATLYDQTDLLTAAETGATIDVSGNWMQDTNYDGIKDKLVEYSMNLVDWINTNNPGASLDEIISGRIINQIFTPIRQTSLPYQTGTPTDWNDIPNSYRIVVDISNSYGISETFYGDEIYGKRLTVFYNGSNAAVLRLDGATVATGSTVALGTTVNFTIYFEHPYPVTWFDEYVYVRTQAGYPTGVGPGKMYWVLGITFGSTSKAMADIHMQNYEEALAAGGTEFDENVLGSQLACLWFTFAAECAVVQDRLERMTQNKMMLHHWACAVNRDTELDTSYIDATSPRVAARPLAGDYASLANFVTVWAMHSNALERLAIQQITGNTNGVAVNNILEVANADGLKIYKGTDTNWSSDVYPNLSNYGGLSLSSLIPPYLSYGYEVLIPEEGQQIVGSLTVSGWGFTNSAGGATGFFSYAKGGMCPWGWGRRCKCKPCDEEEGDPVGLYSGSFRFHQTDISLGSGPYPYSLSFNTEYNSSNRSQDGPLGLGWSHNWQLSVSAISEPFRMLGGDSPIEAVSSLISFFSALDLVSDGSFPISSLITAWLATSWWCEQTTLSVVSAQTWGGIAEFVTLPDGTYRSTDGNEGWLLELNTGEYSITSPGQAKFNYNTDGNLETIEYPFGVTVTLSYSLGKLSTISNGMGRVLTLSYIGDKLQGVSDGNGRSVAYDLDVNNQLEKITDLLGEDTTFSYVDTGLMESFFYPENPSDPVVTNTYDALGRIKSQQLVNSQEQFFYIAGWRTEFVNTAGNSIIRIFDKNANNIKSIDEDENATIFQYDFLNRNIATTYPEGNSIVVAYDDKDNVLTRTQIPKPGSMLENIVQTYTYDATYNKMHTIEDGEGNVTTLNYDPLTGNLLTVEKPEIDSTIPTVTMTYNARGQILTIEDERGMVTAYEYDSTYEILEKITVDDGMGRLNLESVLGYNAWGDINSITDPRTNTTTLTFDNKRRRTEIETCSPFNYVIQFEYDKNDNLTNVRRETGDVGHPWQEFIAEFDIDNLILSAKDPLNNETTYEYNNLRLLWKVTDPETRVTEFQYNSRNKIEHVIDPANVEQQTYQYNSNGFISATEDGNENTTSYSYDGFDRLDQIIFPDESFEQHVSYDKNNNLLKKKTRAGADTEFVYDVLNRIVSKSPFGMPVVSYEFDLTDRLLSVTTPTELGNPASGAFLFGYDTAGRLISEESPDGKTLSYELDENANLIKITFPDSYFVERVYDEMNRLTDIKLNGSLTSAAEFSYDKLSRRTLLSLENGTETQYGYEWNNDLSAMNFVFTGSALDITYGFNNAHQVTSQTVSDSIFMKHPTTGGTISYDATNSLNQYTFVDDKKFSYDKNGCLVRTGEWLFTYDTENHLVISSKCDGSSYYQYDPLHRQIQRQSGCSTKTRYLYDGWQRVVDYNGVSGSLENRYIYGEGLDEVLIKISSAGAKSYFHADRSNSIVALTDGSGVVSDTYAYTPFGENESMTGTSFGFTGQRYDDESNLYYFKNRYYFPEIGRFLQPDFIMDFNLYAYVKNDPLSYSDPFGLQELMMDPYTADRMREYLTDANCIGWAGNSGRSYQYPQGHDLQPKTNEKLKDFLESIGMDCKPMDPKNPQCNCEKPKCQKMILSLTATGDPMQMTGGQFREGGNYAHAQGFDASSYCVKGVSHLYPGWSEKYPRQQPRLVPEGEDLLSSKWGENEKRYCCCRCCKDK